MLCDRAHLPEKPGSTAGSRLAGLLGFLRVLAEHPWRERPLIVDPDGSLSDEQRASAEAAHSKVGRCF